MSDQPSIEGPLSRRNRVRLVAAVDLIGRTGAQGFEIAYDDDTGPVVWNATATYQGAKKWRSADDPVVAVELLAEDLVDGGLCVHCGRTSALRLDGDRPLAAPTICETYRLGARYVRGCA